MRKIKLFCFFFIISCLSYSQGNSFQWAKNVSGTSINGSRTITTDISGNVYISGTFSGTIDLDPSIATYTLYSGNETPYILKLDASGNFLWAVKLDYKFTSMQCNSAGDLIISGYFNNTVDFDPGSGVYNMTGYATNGYDDMVITKINSSGNFLWAKQIGGNYIDRAFALTLDTSGNIYYTGIFGYGADFDPGPSTYTVPSYGGANTDVDFAISKLDPSGNFVWAKSIIGYNSQAAYSIALDAAGNVYTTGSFQGTTNFDPSISNYSLSSANSSTYDVFVCKLNNSGGFIWAKRTPNSGNYSNGNAIVIDGADNLYVGGTFDGVVDFDPGVATYTLTSSGGYKDGFVFKLNSSGNFLWAKRFGGNQDDVINSIALDMSANLYVTGSFSGVVDFDPGPATYSLTSTQTYTNIVGMADAFILKTDSACNLSWAKSFGGVHADDGISISCDPAGNIYTTGNFDGTVDFDTGGSIFNLTPGGTFIHKMAPCTVQPALVNTTPTSNLVFCSGLSSVLSVTGSPTVYWYDYSAPSTVLSSGLTFTTPSLPSGVRTYIAENSFCSSSVRTLITLTVNATPTISVNSGSICTAQNFSITPSGANSYTFSSGTSIVSPLVTTSYTVTGSNLNGCISNTGAVSSVTVVNTPNLSVVCSPSVICIGSNCSLSVLGASGVVKWSFQSGYLNSTASVYVNPSVTTGYSVTAYNQNCSATKPFTVTVTPNYSLNITRSNDTICRGSSVTYTATGANIYYWNNTLQPSIYQQSPLNSTTYTVKGIDVNNCFSNTQTVSIAVKPSPTITVNNGSVCSGQLFTLNPSGANTYTYSSGSATVTPLANTIYTVTGTNTYGCVGSKTSSVNVNPIPTISVNSGSVCLGQPFTIIPNGASTYTYSSISNTVTPVVNSTYTITGTDSNGCVNTVGAISSVIINTVIPTITVNSGSVCLGQTFTMIPNGASTYTYSSISNTVTPLVNSTYTVTGTDSNGCVNTVGAISSVIINTVIPTITVNSGSVCLGQTFTMIPNGASTYTYSSISNTVTPLVNSTYTVTGTDSNGCVNTVGAVSSVIINTVVPTITVNSGSVCLGQPFTLVANGASTYTYSSISNTVTPLVNSTYTVTGTDSNGCVNTVGAVSSVIINTVVPTITVNSGSVCLGQPFTLVANGASTYTFSSISNTVSPLVNSTYTVTGTDSNGCVNLVGAIGTVSVNAIPSLTTQQNIYVCVGTSALLTISGANTYVWSSGETTASITVMPSLSTTYTVTGTDLNNCSSNEIVSVNVNQACQDVWPGDANSDGVADNLDILELGLHYTQTDTARAIISNAWQPYFSHNWAGTLSNGKNMNHSDCNGDGIIDGNDTLAIFINYGLTHAFKPTQQTVVNPDLSIIPDQAFVNKGDWGTASVFLGAPSVPINNVNGIAFTVDFDHTLLESNSAWIEYPVSFIDNGQNLHFRKGDFQNGKLYTATTHTVAMNVSGNGKIGILHYRIKSTLATDAVLSLGISQVFISDANGVTRGVTGGNTTVMAVGASVGLNELAAGSYVSIYPNPATTFATVNSSSALKKITLLSIAGQLLFTENTSGNQYQLNLNGVANGIYYVEIEDINQKVVRQKMVVQH